MSPRARGEALALEWSGAKEFAATPMQDLVVGGLPSGGVKDARPVPVLPVPHSGCTHTRWPLAA